MDRNVAAPNNLISNDSTSRKESRANEATDQIASDNPSMKQSFTKDSESSESIDSVEQSEHALLELCMQPGIKSEGDIAIDERNYAEPPLDSYSKQIDFGSSNVVEEICETDGNVSCKQEAASFEIVRTSDILHRDSAEKEETYRRQRDPDAMIASLDRLTATLVQQTEAMRERDSNTMKQSLTQSDTWNEDSPNDVSFPSISMSAPLVASFNSDAQEDQRANTLENTQVENSEQTSMTESRIIQREAIKLAEAVDAEANNQNDLETTSLTSIDLEAIKPPSTMGSLLSLTASYAGSADTSEVFVGNRDRCYSTSLPPAQIRSASTDLRNVRKKSLPLGVVAKRALGQGAQSHTTSLENLLNECTSSHLENVKPPSMMDELPDVGDMENSMLSVASITSEIADSREQDSHSLTGSDPVVFEMLKPVANVLSITCMRYNGEGLQSSASNSLSECLENINPPSLFNEVSEMDESTVEATTDTLCSDTLCIDTELHTDEVHSIVAEVIDEAENDTDEGATPISSECCVSSSAESTPKKRLYKSHLTPKQKRSLTKERYRTYTIAAEIVKKEEEERRKQEGDKVPRGKCSPFSKLTPKQRRQEDRARFQTQVLENPFSNLAQVNKAPQVSPSDSAEKQEEHVVSPTKSSIPTFTKLPVCRVLRKKQRADSQESRERYRTRTLNDSEAVFKETERSPSATRDEGRQGGYEEIQSMLQQNASIVLNTLNETNKANDSAVRHETIESNLRLRFVNGLSKKLMGSQQVDDAQTPTTSVDDEEAGHVEVAQEDPLDYGSDSDEESNCGNEEPRETKRPRIIKPSRDASADSNATDKSEPGSPKAIRGRRKALYSNPITRKPTPQSSPLKQASPVSGIPIGRSNTSPIVRATRATTLRQNSTTVTATKDSSRGTDAEKRTRNAAAMSKRASVPQKGSSLTFTKSTKRHSTPPACSSNFQSDGKLPEIKPLERQGTFTKDEPEVENAPTVHYASASPVKTKIAKPVKGASSKVYPTAGKSKISVKAHQPYQPKIAKANSVEKVQSPKGLPLLMPPRKVSSGKTGAPAKTVMNGSANVTGPNDNGGGKTFRKVGPLGQRSNSNSSIVSNASAGVHNRAKLAKEATSKIAGLWKRVEESKNKQRFEKPDTRQWIRPANSATEVAPVGQQAFRLFRSSTFEGISQDDSGETSPYKSKRPPVLGSQAPGVKYRNSCDLTGMNASEAPCKIPVKSSESYKRETTQPGENLVTLRKQQSAAEFARVVHPEATDPSKRISRLGSFIRVEPTAENGAVRAPASAIVPPFNYRPDIPSQIRSPADESPGKFEASDCRAEIVTGSARVTTV